MEQFAHVAWMILHVKLILDHVRQQRRGPDAGVQAVSDRAAFDNVVQLLALSAGQFAWASTAMSLLESVDAVLIPVAYPGVNARAVDVKQTGNFGRGVAVQTQENGLQAEGHARGFVSLRFLAESQNVTACPGLSLGEDRSHGAYVVLLMRG